MAILMQHHRKLNEYGEGKCSVPMYQAGLPNGFCDRPAYGERPEGRTWEDPYTGQIRRYDLKYAGYVPGLACPCHGGPKERVFMDGDAFCAVGPDFVNLQESPAGFGETRAAAIEALKSA